MFFYVDIILFIIILFIIYLINYCMYFKLIKVMFKDDV